MVEIPRIRFYWEKLSVVTGGKIINVSGTSYNKSGFDILGFKLVEIRFAGKYMWMFITRRDKLFVVRTHMLMFGKITIDTPTIKKSFMCIDFDNGYTLRWYASQIKILDYKCDDDIVTSNYTQCSSRKMIDDISRMEKMDPSNPKYDIVHHKSYVINNIDLLNHDLIITDLLLDQSFFPGVGNIIQQELLYKCKINPLRKISQIDKKDIQYLIKNLYELVIDFIAAVKNNKYREIIQIYHKKNCPLGHKTITKYISKRNRRTTWCHICQT